jgi:hypothetical protein
MLDGLTAERLVLPLASAAEEETEMEEDIVDLNDLTCARVPQVNLTLPVQPLPALGPQKQPLMLRLPVMPTNIKNASVQVESESRDAVVQVTDGKDETIDAIVVPIFKCPDCFRIYSLKITMSRHTKKYCDHPIKCHAMICSKNHDHDIFIERFESAESALEFSKTRDRMLQFLLYQLLKKSLFSTFY